MSYTFRPLTEAETQVLALLVDGGTNRTIGEQLGCSRFTVKHHVRSIMEKLYALNRVHAAALAVKLDLAEPTKQVNEEYYDTSPPDDPECTGPVKVKGKWRTNELSGWSKLTKREKGICLLLASDEAAEKTSGELADKLNITRNTFRYHRRHIFRKLQVSDRSDLVHKVSRNDGGSHTVIIR